MVVENEYDETNNDEINYKQEYRKLKRKLKLLIYVSIKYSINLCISIPSYEFLSHSELCLTAFEISYIQLFA